MNFMIIGSQSFQVCQKIHSIYQQPTSPESHASIIIVDRVSFFSSHFLFI